ncbi:MAG: LPS assembly protein LptD, partial [Alphaproteobacteria bacterium]
LSAARIEYFVSEDRIVASGGVTLLEPGGEVLRAERAELSEGLKRAVAADLGLRLTDGSRLVGRSMRRDSGVETVVKQAAFTPCALCEEDPERPPIWRLRARKVTHDEAAKDLEYEDVTLDIAGVPVAYLPYFSHPDPTVKRRSGLLAPTLYFGGDLKAIAQVPYFVNIGPNEDLTFQPYFTLKSAPVPALEYRRLFENGEIRFDGSLGKLDREDNSGREKGDVVRGHAFVDGRFDLDETWRLSFDGKVASDDSYLETFHIDSADVLRSTAAVEGFWREDYVRIGAFAGHDLRETADQNDTPFALPELRAALVGAPGRLGYPFLDADARVLGRNQGTSGESASATAGWRAPLFTPDGHRFDLEASVRGDVYDT